MQDEENLFKKLVANELKFCRIENSLTTEKASEKSGISNSTINYYENATGAMKIDVISILLETYNISHKNFFNRIFAKMQEKIKMIKR